MHDAREVANFVLDRCAQLNREVTNLSLQKIVYFCHSWTIAAFGTPLIEEEFEAWPHGPVMPYLYREFKDCDDQPIKRRATKLDKSTGQRVIATYSFPVEIQQLLQKTIDTYSELSAYQLVQMSHTSDGPWHRVWHHKSEVNAGMRISNASILKFYSDKFLPDSAQ